MKQPPIMQNRRPDPTVVAIEGPCFAGKTTLAHALAARLHGVIIPEYADLAPLPPFPPRTTDDVAAALAHFVRLERDRTRAAHAARTTIVILDRSPLTIISYEYGIRQLGVPAAPALAVDMFSAAADSGDILTPDLYVYLTISTSVATARQRRRGAVPAHLTNPLVEAGIDDACQAFLTALPDGRRVQLDGSAPTTANVRRVADLLAQLPDAPAIEPGWRTIANLHRTNVAGGHREAI